MTSLGTLHQEQYWIKRLVFVNSGNNAYTDIPLDKSAAIINQNNMGKSSTLRSIKLFLLPEVNFNGCESKFAFRSTTGLYNGHESHRFYFPDKSSFIICELENPHHTFCQVLYRGSKQLGYERWFVSHPFANIQYLFWDEDSEKNEGMGALTFSDSASVGAELKAMGARTISDKGELRTALYSRYSPGNVLTRFSMVPMAEKPTKEHVATLRSLLDLAFNIGGGHSKGVPQAIATIIDRNMSNREDRIEIDLSGIISEFNSLKAEGRRLKTLRKHQPDWEALDKQWRAFCQQSRAWCALFEETSGQVYHQTQGHQGRTRLAKEELDQLEETHNVLSSNASDLNKEIERLTGELRLIEKDISKLTLEKKEIESLRARYRPLNINSDDAILNEIENSPDGIKVIERQLEAMQTREKTQAELQSYLDRRSKLQDERTRIQDRIDGRSHSLLSGVNPQSASVLVTLNNAFEHLSGELMPAQISTLENFTALFDVQDDVLMIADQPIPGVHWRHFDIEEIKRGLQTQKEVLKKEFRNIDINISELRQYLQGSEDSRARRLEVVQEDLKQAEREYKTIKWAERALTDLSDKSAQADEIRETKASLMSKLSDVDDQKTQAESTRDEHYRKYETLVQQRDALKNQQNQLEKMRAQVNLFSMDLSSPSTLPAPEDFLTTHELNERVDSLREQLVSLKDLFYGVRARMQDIDRDDVAEATSIDFSAVQLTAYQLTEYHQLLASIFTSIDQKEAELRNRIASHNHETSIHITFIKNLSDEVQSYQRKLNSKLDALKVSNLSSVQLGITTNHRFRQLQSDLEKQYQHHTDTLQDEAFYSRIQTFCDEYLETKAGKLDLSQIIEDVSWSYELNGVTESSAQSNGTTGLLNASLLSIFLRDLIADDVRVRLPIIYDEAGNLDAVNFRNLKSEVEKNGFILFAANPTANGTLIAVMGDLLNLGMWTLSDQRPVNNKCLVLYSNQAESLINREPSATAEEGLEPFSDERLEDSEANQ